VTDEEYQGNDGAAEAEAYAAFEGEQAADDQAAQEAGYRAEAEAMANEDTPPSPERQQ